MTHAALQKGWRVGIYKAVHVKTQQSREAKPHPADHAQTSQAQAAGPRQPADGTLLQYGLKLAAGGRKSFERRGGPECRHRLRLLNQVVIACKQRVSLWRFFPRKTAGFAQDP